MAQGAPKTTVPFTYVIDYEQYLNEPDEFIEKLAQAPPHLLHVSHDAPFNNTWGPFYQPGSFQNTPIRLSPEKMQGRISLIRDYVDRLHKAGVDIFVPYICNQTLAGNLEKRTGIWEFYDRWEEYSEFDFGERPEVDPVEWMARERNGRIHYNYEKRHSYFARWDQHRYAPCMNNPYYNRYQKGIVLNIAKVGYDGVFVDNNILSCYCQYCQERFRTYLERKYSREEIRERFGTEDTSQIQLGYRGNRIEWVKDDPEFLVFLRETQTAEELERRFGTSNLDEALIEDAGNGWLSRCAGVYQHYLEMRYPSEAIEEKFGSPDISLWGIRSPEERALWAETKRFWADSVNENLGMIKEAGASVRGDFAVVPNWGAMQSIEGNEFREEHGKDVKEWVPSTDCMMYEEDRGPGRIARGIYLDYILPRKFAFANGMVSGNVCNGTYSGEANSNELAYAEAAAGGGGCFIQVGPVLSEIRGKYNQLYKEHRNLFEDYTSYADVALAHIYEQIHMENLEHIRQVYKLTRYLLDQHILFDYLVDGDLTLERLSGYRALILPEVQYMSDKEVQAVEDFARGGGTVILTGDTGRYDQNGKKRPDGGFDGLLTQNAKDEGGITIANPGGWLVHGQDLSRLLPEDRLACDELLGFYKGDLVDQVDVSGPKGYYVMAQIDRKLRVDRYLQGGRMFEYLKRSLGYDPGVADPFEGAGVRFSAYKRQEGTLGKLVLHVVNYNLPLPEGEPIVPVRELKLRLRVPDGWKIEGVQLLEPGIKPETLKFNVAGGTLELALPEIRFHKIIDVSAAVR